MPAPKNRFKQALKEGRAQIGLWQALASPYTVEICAEAGYDWLLLDAEHAPNDVPLLVSQLQAM
jgi:4-hydroxy-2-oxoheptanedioate aldolase